MLMNEILMLSN